MKQENQILQESNNNLLAELQTLNGKIKQLEFDSKLKLQETV